MQINLKRGQAVIATSSRNAVEIPGRFSQVIPTPRGAWLEVNVAEKGKTQMLRRYRPSQVRAA